MDNLCRECSPEPSPEQQRYLEVTKAAMDAEPLWARPVRAEWDHIAEAEADLRRLVRVQHMVKSMAAAHPDEAHLAAVSRSVTHAVVERIDEIAHARSQAPEPAVALLGERIAQVFGDDEEVRSRASRLCRVVSWYQREPYSRAGNARDLLARTVQQWTEDSAANLAAFVYDLLAGSDIVDLRELAGPARTSPAGHATVASWAHAELAALAAELTEDWPARLAAIRDQVLADDDAVLLRVTSWPPSKYDGRSHLLRYPVIAEADIVRGAGPGRSGSRAAVLRVPSSVAAHATRKVRGDDVVSASLPADLPATPILEELVKACAYDLLAQVAFVPRHLSGSPSQEVLDLREKVRERGVLGYRREHWRLWVPRAADGPELTKASARELARVLKRADALYFQLDGAGTSLNDLLVCDVWELEVSDDGRCLQGPHGISVPLSTLVAVAMDRD